MLLVISSWITDEHWHANFVSSPLEQLITVHCKVLSYLFKWFNLIKNLCGVQYPDTYQYFLPVPIDVLKWNNNFK